MKKTQLALTLWAISLFVIELPLSADLVYDFVPYDLVDENTGDMVVIAGGTITMVDGADSDGVLTSAEVVSTSVSTNIGIFSWFPNNENFLLTSNLTFVDGTLQGGLFFENPGIDGEFIEYFPGSGTVSGLLSLVTPTIAIAADWEGPFVVAQASSVPEPGCAGIFADVVAVLGSRRKLRSI